MKTFSLTLLLKVRQVRERAAERRLQEAQQDLQIQQEACAMAQARLARYQPQARRHRHRLLTFWERTQLSHCLLLRCRDLEAQVSCRLLGLSEAVRLAQAAVTRAEEEVATARIAWRRARAARMKLAEVVAQGERQRALQVANREAAVVEECAQRRSVHDALLG